VKAEHTIGRSRFDFLLRRDGKDILLEVKSCTLFNGTLAMFPDAISARATKHIEELAHLSGKGYGAAVLFVVHWPQARWFMPEHHTDLAFSRALYTVRDRVMVRAVSVGWEKDLSLRVEETNRTKQDKSFSRKARKVRKGKGQELFSAIPASLRETALAFDVPFARELTIPWDLVDRESHDRGCYIIVLRLTRDRKIEVGGLGAVKFLKGYYLYVGSAMKDLTKRIERHRRLTKKFHWHIDHLREYAEFHAAIPIRASVDLECKVAAAIHAIADWNVPGFGSSDCGCDTHCFGMHDDPVHSPEFIKMLLYYRMGRLEEELEGRQTGGRGDAATGR